MRARNPCVLLRRLLRGRYEGFILNSLSGQENYPRQTFPVKVDFSTCQQYVRLPCTPHPPVSH